jgi:hypothetical protein
MIYLFVIFLLVFLSIRYDINGKIKYRDHWYYVMLVILVLMAGLRYRLMVDTPNYLFSFYHEYPDLKNFSFSDYPIGNDPFYVLINSIVKSLGGRFYVVQLIEATVVNVMVFKYIKKHSSYLFTCVFFYFVTYYFGYSMETMRASFSIVICLFANDYILDRKWIKGYLLYLLALMFHGQTILMFVIPLLFLLRLNKYGILVLFGAFIAGYVIQKGFGDYIELFELGGKFDTKTQSYAESDYFSNQIGNFNFYIVNILPYMIYAIISLGYLKYFYPNNKTLRLEPFVMAGVFFLVMQMNMQIAYRYVDYFCLHFVIIYAEVFVLIAQKTKRFDWKLACVRAVFFFLPYFMTVGYVRYSRLYTIYPYSSVIERSIDKERESKYENRPPANINEY